MPTSSRLFVTVLAASVMATAYGQVGTVGICNPGTPMIGYSPGNPWSTTPIAITVAAANLHPQSVAAVVQGNAIDVTLSGIFFGFSPPGACGTVVVGPLPRGTYTINSYLVLSGGAPTLQGTLPLTVADPIPTLSSFGLGILVSIMALVGGLYVYRMRGRGGCA